MPKQYQTKPVVGQIQVVLRDRCIANFTLKGDLSVILRYIESETLAGTIYQELAVYGEMIEGRSLTINNRYHVAPLVPEDKILAGV